MLKQKWSKTNIENYGVQIMLAVISEFICALIALQYLF